jgi:hypothetical protein
MLSIVEVVRAEPKGRNIWVREIYPSANDEEVFATMTTNMPLSQEGGGMYSMPKVEPGVKCIAMRYSYQFFILGFFSDFNPQGGWRQTVDLDEELDENDLNIRTPSGNRVTLEGTGRVSIFANLWSRLHLSKSLDELSGYFKKIRMTWFGGSIRATEETFKMSITDGYDDPELSDVDLDTEELVSSSTTALTAADATTLGGSYISKAIIDNVDVPLKIETRQRTNSFSQPQTKDSYTIEKRGRDGDDLYSLETIDRARGVVTMRKVDAEGVKQSVQKLQSQSGLPPAEGTVLDVQLNANLGERSELLYVTPDHTFETSIVTEEGEDRFKLVSNNDSINIGDTFSIKRLDDEGAELVTIEFDLDGVLNIKTPHAQIQTDLTNGATAPDLYVNVLDGGKLHLGSAVDGEALDFESAQGDNVMTTKTILGPDVLTDTFTGIPWTGSQTVAAKE